jgi:hypothetical protein
VWWREGRELAYRRLTDDDRAALDKDLAEHGRTRHP